METANKTTDANQPSNNSGEKPPRDTHKKNINQQIKEENEQLKRIVRANLDKLFNMERGSRVAVADECNVSVSTVTRWTSNENSLPGPEHLKRIADHFHCPVDWILSDHKSKDEFGFVSTYSDAARALLPLIRNETINIETINDEILRHVCIEFEKANDHPAVPDDVKTKWINRIIKEFNSPLPDAQNKDIELWRFIRKTESDVAHMDIFQEFANLAKIVGNKDRMEKMKEKYNKYLKESAKKS